VSAALGRFEPLCADDGRVAMRMKEEFIVTGANIENIDAWMKIRAARQLAEYIHDLVAEMSRMARESNCASLATILQMASLEAKKLSLEHGCEMSLNTVREDCH
jgi:hypothetical protein